MRIITSLILTSLFTLSAQAGEKIALVCELPDQGCGSQSVMLVDKDDGYTYMRTVTAQGAADQQMQYSSIEAKLSLSGFGIGGCSGKSRSLVRVASDAYNLEVSDETDTEEFIVSCEEK